MNNTIKLMWWAMLIILSACRNYNPTNRENRFNYYETFGETGSIRNIKPDSSSIYNFTVPDDLNKTSIRVDTILKEQKLIQLETNENCMIRHIDEIIAYDNRIIVVDKTREQVAFIFSAEGEFLAQLGSKGRGPNEYLSLRDIALNNKTSEIVLYDGKGRKLMFYDKNGKFIKKKNSFVYGDNLAIINENCFVYSQLNNVNTHISGIHDYQIIIADSTQQIISKAFSYNYPERNKKIDIYNMFNFSNYSNKLYFNPLFTNQVYQITDEASIDLVYDFNLKEMDVLNNLKDFKNNDDYINDFNINRSWGFHGILLEASDWTYAKIKNGGMIYFNRENNNTIYGNSISFIQLFENKENIGYKNKFFTNTVSASDGFFIGYIWPFELFYNNNESEKLEFSDLKKPVNYDDNPILQFYKLK